MAGEPPHLCQMAAAVTYEQLISGLENHSGWAIEFAVAWFSANEDDLRAFFDVEEE